MSTDLLPDHLPIREMGDTWSVLFIDENEVEHDINCDSHEHAKALANARPFNTAFFNQQKCDPIAVKQTIEALERYGLSTALIYRNLEHLSKSMDDGDI